MNPIQCRCESMTQLEGAEAAASAQQHLRQARIDSVDWKTEYVCPDTGLEDYPRAELQGGGPPRLRLLPIAHVSFT